MAELKRGSRAYLEELENEIIARGHRILERNGMNDNDIEDFNEILGCLSLIHSDYASRWATMRENAK